MDAAPPSWAGAKRPEIKRTYQSKFSKAGKSSSLAQTLLDRAVWAYDALFAAAPPKPKLRLSKSSAGPPPDENTDPRVSGAAAEDVMASFSRLSLCRVRPLPLLWFAPSLACACCVCRSHLRHQCPL